MSSKIVTVFCLIVGLNSLTCYGARPDSTHVEVWELNSLKKIGGHGVHVFGNPKIVKTEIGKAIWFDGVDDRLLVDSNPVGDSKEFTIEVIFKPDPAYLISQQPRFIHFQDLSDTLSGWNAADRITMELRLTPDNQWYLDGFLLTDAGERTLQNKELTHPASQWVHAALTYKDNVFKTYINGIEEISGDVTYQNRILNKKGNVSLGGRMNRVYYYRGLIKEVKVTRKALNPQQFVKTVLN